MPHPWKAMSELVNEVVNELESACNEYPYSSIGEWFDNDEFNARTAIRHREHIVFAEMARYFKAHPDRLEKWSKMYEK